MKMLGELENIQVRATVGGGAECYSSSFVSSSRLICAFVFSCSFSRQHLQYFDDNVSFLADCFPEIADNISLDSPDQDLIVNWSRSGKRNKKPPLCLARANCCIVQAACFDVSGTSSQPCALSPLLPDVSVNWGDTEELQSEFSVQRRGRREQRAALQAWAPSQTCLGNTNGFVSRCDGC